MDDWKSIAEQYYEEGWTVPEITTMLKNMGYDVTYDQVYNRTKRAFRNKEVSSSSVANKPTKNVVVCNQEPKIIDSDWQGEKIIKFGLMGDTQIGSKYAQITLLHALYDIYEKEGITDVYHTGDITDGVKMRPGHEFELYTVSADDMTNHVIRDYPHKKGMTTHFITGNHDASMYKHIGYDIGATIAKERSDMDYLGRDCAVVNITPNCTLELRHPWDGTAYALSYKLQKMIEAMDSDSKPNILAVGHYHKAEYIFYRNVHAIQTACLQSQTPFTRGKGIAVNLGGWIVTVHVDSSGTIKRIKPEFIPFYKAIKDDYKNYI